MVKDISGMVRSSVRKTRQKRRRVDIYTRASMRNPFIYGGLVFGDHFADRQNELSDLTTEMSNAEKVFLVSSRRLGKTCLLRNLQENLKLWCQIQMETLDWPNWDKRHRLRLKGICQECSFEPLSFLTPLSFLYTDILIPLLSHQATLFSNTSVTRRAK